MGEQPEEREQAKNKQKKKGIIIVALSMLVFAIVGCFAWFYRTHTNSRDYLEQGKAALAKKEYEIAKEEFDKGVRLSDASCNAYYALLIAMGKAEGESEFFEYIEAAAGAEQEILDKACQIQACNELAELEASLETEHLLFFSKEDVKDLLERLNALTEYDALLEYDEEVPGSVLELELWDRERLHRVLYYETLAYYQLTMLYEWQEREGWEEADVIPGDVDYEAGFETAVRKLLLSYPKSMEESAMTLDDIRNGTGVDGLESLNVTSRTQTVAEHMVEHIECQDGAEQIPDKTYWVPLETDGGSDSSLSEQGIEVYSTDELYYYRRGCYILGSAYWYTEAFGDTGSTLSDALQCWLLAADLGDPLAVERLAEFYWYGVSAYTDGTGNVKGVFPSTQEEARYYAEIFAQAAANLCNVYAIETASFREDGIKCAHAYTILARLDDDPDGQRDKIAKAIEKGDAYAWCLYNILGLVEVDPENEEGNAADSEEEQIYREKWTNYRKAVAVNDENAVKPWEGLNGYALAHMGEEIEKEDPSESLRYYGYSVKKGCELGAYKLASYYVQNGDKDTAQKYINLSKLLRDIHYGRTCDLEKKIQS